MTAIVLGYTEAGFVIVADGRSRWNDDSTRDEFTYQNESEHEQKIFKGSFGTVDIGWAVTGVAFNKDKSFSLVTEVKKALEVANSSHWGFGDWIIVFGSALRSSISAARNSGKLEPYSEN
jgi:hypothetical protein